MFICSPGFLVHETSNLDGVFLFFTLRDFLSEILTFSVKLRTQKTDNNPNFTNVKRIYTSSRTLVCVFIIGAGVTRGTCFVKQLSLKVLFLRQNIQKLYLKFTNEQPRPTWYQAFDKKLSFY